MDKPAMSMEEVGRQLRKPEGEDGVKVGLAMNKSNAWLYDTVLDVLALRPDDRILEIGFGNGYFIPSLFEREQAITYTGLDMSDTMVAEAAKVNEARIGDGSVKLFSGRAEEMSFPDQAFTKVFGVNVLYFWDEPSVTLKAIHRVLEKGGELVLGIRSKESMQQMPFVAQGFTLYDAKTAKALLEANGFQVNDIIITMEPERLSGDGSTMVQLENICLRGIKF